MRGKRSRERERERGERLEGFSRWCQRSQSASSLSSSWAQGFSGWIALDSSTVHPSTHSSRVPIPSFEFWDPPSLGGHSIVLLEFADRRGLKLVNIKSGFWQAFASLTGVLFTLLTRSLGVSMSQGQRNGLMRAFPSESSSHTSLSAIRTSTSLSLLVYPECNSTKLN